MANVLSTVHQATPEQLEQIGAIAAGMVRNGDRVGLGSGRAALSFVRALGKRIREQKLKAIGVATSLLTEEVAREAGVPTTTLVLVEALVIGVDGAVVVDPFLFLRLGGGGNLTREKVVASIASKFVIVVGEEKVVSRLGTHFPVFVEVIEYARPVVTRRLHTLGATVVQRLNKDGTPFLTDNGNPYLQARFGTEGNYQLHDPYALDLTLHAVPGVVETGLFINMADEVIVAHADGTVEHKT